MITGIPMRTEGGKQELSSPSSLHALSCELGFRKASIKELAQIYQLETSYLNALFNRLSDIIIAREISREYRKFIDSMFED